MLSTVNQTPMCTWQTGKGELSLYQTGKEYSLQLLTKEHQIVEIPKQNIHGSFFDTQSEKISEICNQYLPVIKTEKNMQSFSVTFHPSTCPGDKEEDCNQQGPVSKGVYFGFDFNNLETTFYVNFSFKAPFYRRVVKGLNFEGKCQETTCKAYKQCVIIPFGIGKFNIPEEMGRSVCPACDTTLDFQKITNLGFWDCKYTIDGKRKDTDDGKRKDTDTTIYKQDTAPSDKYKTFTPGKKCTWVYLEVTTELIAQSKGGNSGGCVLF